MSQWLRNVGSFLEQLDDKASVAVTAGHGGDEDGDDALAVPYSSDPLTRAYLENQAYHEDQELANVADAVDATGGGSQPLVSATSSVSNDVDFVENPSHPVTSDQRWDDIPSDNVVETPEPKGIVQQENLTKRVAANTEEFERADAEDVPVTQSTTPETPMQTPEQCPPLDANDAGAKQRVLEHQAQDNEKRLLQMQQEKQREAALLAKEAWTLRRHMAALNEQLTVANKEVEAQSLELENAAKRLDTDRIKHKHDLQAAAAKHTAALNELQRSHAEILASAQALARQQVDEVRQQLHDVHQQRQQEGGDWHVELADAVRREQEVGAECAALRDETSTLLTQIATLRAQQETLGNRLESLTATADTAVAREREAETRLDDVLSLHARQVSQRQAREAELEQSVADLSAAIVAERSKKESAAASTSEHGGKVVAATDQSPGDGTAQVDADKVEELVLLRSHLEHERQQTATLQRELRDVARERQDDAVAAQVLQAQHDRHLFSLGQQLAELRAATASTVPSSSPRALPQQHQDDDDAQHQQQMCSMADHQRLSDEVVRLRDKMSGSSSEIAALRARLHVALNRATVAEAAAETAFATNSGGGGADSDWPVDNDDAAERGMRRRNAASNKSPSSRAKGNYAPTMRAALWLDGLPGAGSNSQSIGKSLDVLDGFLSSSGKILRHNPVARLFFGTCVSPGRAPNLRTTLFLRFCFGNHRGLTYHPHPPGSALSCHLAPLDVFSNRLSCAWF